MDPGSFKEVINLNLTKLELVFPALSKSRKRKRRVLVFLRFKLILRERWVVQDCSNVHTVSISALTPVTTPQKAVI